MAAAISMMLGMIVGFAGMQIAVGRGHGILTGFAYAGIGWAVIVLPISLVLARLLTA